MTDVCLRIDRWLSGDLSDDADKTLRDARDEIVALRAKLAYVEQMFRERTNHDAAPAARAYSDSVGTDKAEPLTRRGTGDTLSPIAKCDSDSPQAVASTPEPHATPGDGTSHGGRTLTPEERESVIWAATMLPAMAHPSSASAHCHAAVLRRLWSRLS